jgi:hypothetical protein
MDDIGYQSWKEQCVLLPRQDFVYKKKSTIKKRLKSSKIKLPGRRISVKYAHACVSKELHQAKIPHLKKTHGKNVVRIICRTSIQLQNLNPILKQIIQHKYIEEIGMPLNWIYTMKQLVVFIKPFDAKCSKKIEDKFRNSGFNFHVTVFDVENTCAKNEKLFKIPDDESKTKNLEIKSIAKIQCVKSIGTIIKILLLLQIGTIIFFLSKYLIFGHAIEN